MRCKAENLGIDMRSALDLLDELNAVDESIQIEAKRSQELGRSALETISAFANEPALGGGYLLLGVDWTINDQGDRVYWVTGLPDPDKLQSDIASQCASAFNLVVRPEMRVERVNGKPVLVVFVQEADPGAKPVYFKATGLPKGAWRRIGSTDQRCTEEDLWVLRGIDQPQQSYDQGVVSDASSEDFDPQAISEYRRLRERVNPSAEELLYDDSELLEALGALKRVDGGLRPTVAGIILFAKTMALRRLFPAMRIDYLRIPGTEWVEDPEERFQSLDIRKPLLLALRQLEATVIDDLPKGFHLPEGALQSEQEPILSRRVIREALSNAVMHRNYRLNEPIQVVRYSNRLEISNPGYSLKNPANLGEPGSRQRNPLIAAVLHDLNLAETKGSGIRTMRRIAESAGMTPPEFISDRVNDRFRATLHLHHFLQEDDHAWLQSLSSESLSTDASKVLIYVRETEAVDNTVCRSLTGLDTLQASILLRRLRDLGLLLKRGAGNRTYYIPGPAFHPSDSKPAGSNEHHPSDNTHHPSDNTHHPPDNTHQFDIPSSLLQRLPSAGSKPRRDLLRQLIVDLCGVRPFSAKELSDLLGRQDPKALVRTYLTPLIQAGELVYTIREMPNHPDQRYSVPHSAAGGG